jgi:integrase
MAVKQVDIKKATKDGRRWQFYIYIYNGGIRKKYFSKLFATKSEAVKAERNYLESISRKEINITDMTFKDLYDEFYEYKKDKVKRSTMRTYEVNSRPMHSLFNLKIKDFEIKHYLKWRSEIANQNIALRTKNGYYKFFKNLLNYGAKWHDFNFGPIYSKMEKFTDPNAIPKEMEFYTWEEFKQFLSVEEDLKFRCVFETLYYCGLRRGELRGLTWDNLDFEDKTLSVTKNCVNLCGDGGFWLLTTPKTRTSARTIPMPDVLVEDLIKYKEEVKKYYGFNNKWFVFGDVNPLHPDVLRRHKNDNARKAGVKQIRIHDFRHSCASVLINNGASIMIVAKYLGHAKIDETLNTYSHLFKSKMDDIVNMLNKMSKDN